jgi:hypothetical protein
VRPGRDRHPRQQVGQAGADLRLHVVEVDHPVGQLPEDRIVHRLQLGADPLQHRQRDTRERVAEGVGMTELAAIQEVGAQRDRHLVQLRQSRRALRLAAPHRVDDVPDDRPDDLVAGPTRLGALGQDAQVVGRRRRHPEQRPAAGGIAVVAQAVRDLERQIRVAVHRRVGEQPVLVQHVVAGPDVALVDGGAQERVEHLHHGGGQAVIVALDRLLADQPQHQRDGIVDVVQLVEGGEEHLAELVEHPDLDPGIRLFDLADDHLVAASEVLLLDLKPGGRQPALPFEVAGDAPVHHPDAVPSDGAVLEVDGRPGDIAHLRDMAARLRAPLLDAPRRGGRLD